MGVVFQVPHLAISSLDAYFPLVWLLCSPPGPGASVLKASLPTIHPLLSGFNNDFIHYFVHSLPLNLFPKNRNLPFKLTFYSAGKVQMGS